jgi:hypothetical protein
MTSRSRRPDGPVPSSEGNTGPLGEKPPEVWEGVDREIYADQEREGSRGREKLPVPIQAEGKPERSQSPREHAAPARTNPSGAKRGTASSGEKTAEAPIRSRNGFGKKRKSG